ncbi:MAG: C40 family peptidase [Elusimicrobia bacterium]|nr:C40 family peptidase [Elusimicrobiota bacterium]
MKPGLLTASAAAAALLLSACVAPQPRRMVRGRGAAVASWARRELGKPYRFGGDAPAEGFDCSGLAWWAHRQAGIDIPPTAHDQFRSGRQVVRSALLPGDLVFFHTVSRGASHVGVYVGGGVFIHAPRRGERVRRERLKVRYWAARYLGARRYW